MIDAYYKLVATYLASRRPLEAIRAYETALRLHPGDPQLLAAIARAKQMAGIR